MSPWPGIARLVPHGGRMCLLDAVLACDSHRLEATFTPDASDPFAGEAGIGAHVGLEWMAQAVAAWATLNAAGENGAEAPAPGMLVSVRRFESTCVHFPFGEPVTVAVELELSGANGLYGFRGTLKSAGEQRAEAEFRVYQPTLGERDQPAPDASQEPR
ncbi:putative hotdog family 3-hydroxylacyl-ACP dehydratase [Kushneria sinocarnis]|uniref:Putative hotdog family 3-hydroxylacyl-ACP dehydratase n=1 Tax=Kushneria sinocarnis TaxID=595502 RepID=A0A420WXA1_9GAMM|nr:hypothetical protein [Kushneria sinocarnis]RKR04348.1 putative hotdog family 3-hydroxylacyl-ACP dehydratase [Kushneria sinocarnis]